jgi:hypothetical protein
VRCLRKHAVPSAELVIFEKSLGNHKENRIHVWYIC